MTLLNDIVPFDQYKHTDNTKINFDDSFRKDGPS